MMIRYKLSLYDFSSHSVSIYFCQTASTAEHVSLIIGIYKAAILSFNIYGSDKFCVLLYLYNLVLICELVFAHIGAVNGHWSRTQSTEVFPPHQKLFLAFSKIFTIHFLS